MWSPRSSAWKPPSSPSGPLSLAGGSRLGALDLKAWSVALGSAVALDTVNFIFLCPCTLTCKRESRCFLPGLLWGSEERTHSWCSVNISGEVFCPGHALVPNILCFWLFSRRIWCPPVSVHLFFLLPLPDPAPFFGEIVSVFLDSVKMSPFQSPLIYEWEVVHTSLWVCNLITVFWYFSCVIVLSNVIYKNGRAFSDGECVHPMCTFPVCTPSKHLAQII